MAWHAFNQGNKATKTEEGGGLKNFEKGREKNLRSRHKIGGVGWGVRNCLSGNRDQLHEVD